MEHPEKGTVDRSDVAVKSASMRTGVAKKPDLHLVKSGTSEVLDVSQEEISIPQKGDIFENLENGQRITVEGVEREGSDIVVAYTESAHGGTKHDGKIWRKPLRNFSVLVKVGDMQAIDHIKGQHPEFYALYEREMKKTDDAFVREYNSCEDALESWYEHIEKEYGPYLNGDMQDTKQQMTGKIALNVYQSLHDKLEKIGRGWNALDDHFVRNGRQRMRLLSELHSLGDEMPEEILQLKKEALINLEKEFGTENPDVELIDRGYFRILLERRVAWLREKCDLIRHGKAVSIASTSDLHHFLQRVETLSASVNAETSSKDIKKALHTLNVLEHKTLPGGKEERRTEKRSKGRDTDDVSVNKIQRRRPGFRDTADADNGRKKTNKPARNKSKRTEEVVDVGVQDGGVADVTALESQRVTSSPEAVTSEVAEAPKVVAVQGGNKDGGKTHKGEKPAKKDERKRDRELFDKVAGLLKEHQVFRKDGQPLCIIRELTSEAIRVEYRASISETQWQHDTIKPNNIKRFLDYLRSEFDWTLNKKGAAHREKDVRSKRKRGKKSGEGSRKPEKSETPSVASAPHTSEKPTPKERTYEQLAEALSAVKKEWCKRFVAGGLAPLEQYMKQNTGMTLPFLIQRLGEEKLVQSIQPSIVGVLSGENWNEQEKLLFAAEYVRRAIKETP